MGRGNSEGEGPEEGTSSARSCTDVKYSTVMG